MNMLAEFLSQDMVYLSSVLFILGFIIWELPRSMRVIGEEYTKGVYPPSGRVFDFLVLFTGIACLAFFLMNTGSVIGVMKMPTFSLAFTVTYIAVPVLIIFGLVRRVLKRINNEAHDSLVAFMVQSFLDLAHTVFFAAFSLIFIPVVIFFIVRLMMGGY